MRVILLILASGAVLTSNGCDQKSPSDLALQMGPRPEFIEKAQIEKEAALAAAEKAQKDAEQARVLAAAEQICPRPTKGRWRVSDYQIDDGVVSIDDEEARLYVGKIFYLDGNAVRVGPLNCTASEVDTDLNDEGTPNQTVSYYYYCKETERNASIYFSENCSSPQLRISEASFPLSDLSD